MIGLASGSPRRRHILDLMQVSYRANALDLDESLPAGKHPGLQAKAIAGRKALQASLFDTSIPWLGVDTFVVQRDHRLGKAATRADAEAMWRQYDAPVQVVSGMCLALAGQPLFTGADAATITFAVPEEVRDEYLDGQSWKGKAGAFGLQDAMLAPYLQVDGAFSTCVGMPLELLQTALDLAGVSYQAIEEEELRLALTET